MSSISFRKSLLFRCIAYTVLAAFVGLLPTQPSYAQVAIVMPSAGQMIHVTSHFEPPQMMGLKVNLKDPFSFDFIMDQGQSQMSDSVKKEEFNKIIKYFLVSLAMPNKDMWVNLSPYEATRIIPMVFAQTEMGRDLLAQDYLLKQFTASLMYPEGGLGKQFWSKVYAEAQARFGTTDIKVDTFNKVWIVADKADIYQKDDTAFLVNSHLKVMLEQDYMALTKNKEQFGNVTGLLDQNRDEKAQMASQIVREIVIPAIEKEVNDGKSFAAVRQVYNAEIMATWFKKTLRQSLLGYVFANRSKIAGQKNNDPQVTEKIYQQYLKAYKKGVFNYIKEESMPDGQTVPRKYFSGGLQGVKESVINIHPNPAMVTRFKNWARNLLPYRWQVATVLLATVAGVSFSAQAGTGAQGLRLVSSANNHQVLSMNVSAAGWHYRSGQVANPKKNGELLVKRTFVSSTGHQRSKINVDNNVSTGLFSFPWMTDYERLKADLPQMQRLENQIEHIPTVNTNTTKLQFQTIQTNVLNEVAGIQHVLTNAQVQVTHLQAQQQRDLNVSNLSNSNVPRILNETSVEVSTLKKILTQVEDQPKLFDDKQKADAEAATAKKALQDTQDRISSYRKALMGLGGAVGLGGILALWGWMKFMVNKSKIEELEAKIRKAEVNKAKLQVAVRQLAEKAAVTELSPRVQISDVNGVVSKLNDDVRMLFEEFSVDEKSQSLDEMLKEKEGLEAEMVGLLWKCIQEIERSKFVSPYILEELKKIPRETQEQVNQWASDRVKAQKLIDVILLNGPTIGSPTQLRGLNAALQVLNQKILVLTNNKVAAGPLEAKVAAAELRPIVRISDVNGVGGKSNGNVSRFLKEFYDDKNPQLLVEKIKKNELEARMVGLLWSCIQEIERSKSVSKYILDELKRFPHETKDEFDQWTSDKVKAQKLIDNMLLYGPTIGAASQLRALNAALQAINHNIFVLTKELNNKEMFVPSGKSDNVMRSLVVEKLPGNEDPLGGINLNDENLTINIKVDGAGIPLPPQFQDKAMMSLDGLVSIISKITPLTIRNVPVLYELVHTTLH